MTVATVSGVVYGSVLGAGLVADIAFKKDIADHHLDPWRAVDQRHSFRAVVRPRRSAGLLRAARR